MAIDISRSSIPLFQSRDRLELLNDIDKFRQRGLANLPQIVVCGDTSSGKSSVLGALSGIPFPVDSTICTKFATEIALRYSSDETVTGEATINPGPSSSEDQQARTASFRRAVTSLDAIPVILREAEEVMGVSGTEGISRDVLRLKLRGRPLPNLTLVDLPGLIHSAEDRDDLAKVKDLIKHYFEQKESLIMVIVSAENPINGQGLLTLSQEFDPKGERCIGVITKPDTLQHRGKAAKILELARNKNPAFNYKRDWQIVRCLTDDERQRGADRDRIESDLLSREPWDSFDKKRLGTKSLRSALCEYLEEHILHLLPELVNSVEEETASVKLSLHELGPHRTTPDERRQYLIRISRRYVQLVQAALNGDYSDSFFGDGVPAKRLRAKTMALTDEFEHTMLTRGHVFEVADVTSSQPASYCEPQRIALADALVKVGKLMEGYRGPELPLLFNPRLVRELFKEQSQNWPTFASKYTADICRAVQVFLRKVMDSICPSTGRVGELILREVFQDAIQNHRDELNNKVLELFTPHTGSFLYSMRDRLQASLENVRRQNGIWGDASVATSDKPSPFPSNVQDTGSNEDPRLTALQLSMAYYSVALETFVDNVVVLGVESCLLSKLEEMFSPETVAEMQDDKLQLLGGETPEIISKRRNLEARLRTLEEALKNFRRHASREFGLEFEGAPGAPPRPVSEPPRSSSTGNDRPESLSSKHASVDATPVSGNAASMVHSLTPQPQPLTNFATTPKNELPSNQKFGSNMSGTPITDVKNGSPAQTSPLPKQKISQPPVTKISPGTVANDKLYTPKALIGDVGTSATTSTAKESFPTKTMTASFGGFGPPIGGQGSTTGEFTFGPPASGFTLSSATKKKDPEGRNSSSPGSSVTQDKLSHLFGKFIFNR
ncbi:uncharacterized protein Z519_06601 [Cladophialophora bantiana CBS 173.52]|uniref:GED domain-containing protein n=1 Tax=Cladophialophora bantiana (strain ATCC 10958 / CBS 173.52 / CDC B-1940 / NIH 8579) TaxID=1442370 RepID=A0A0D2HHL1_CLAB1|nr:uncharacterized protein Z519_06601 [Cladophialophora bantiana CBS 173.52]KIW92753.1 hypothetical protein Z519_06601 [Cladophialophora bantiana CBS 173.52]